MIYKSDTFENYKSFVPVEVQNFLKVCICFVYKSIFGDFPKCKADAVVATSNA